MSPWTIVTFGLSASCSLRRAAGRGGGREGRGDLRRGRSGSEDVDVGPPRAPVRDLPVGEAKVDHAADDAATRVGGDGEAVARHVEARAQGNDARVDGDDTALDGHAAGGDAVGGVGGRLARAGGVVPGGVHAVDADDAGTPGRKARGLRRGGRVVDHVVDDLRVGPLTGEGLFHLYFIFDDDAKLAVADAIVAGDDAGLELGQRG